MTYYYPTSPTEHTSLHDARLLEYARGALELRKKRNRKRTLTGEFVWTEDADLVFTLGLTAWHTDPSVRCGTKRSFFLESFLADHGIKKTRKQIASRLQVLKGEWHGTQYQELLKHPFDGPESPPQTPPVSEESLATSPTFSRKCSRSPTIDLDETRHSHNDRGPVQSIHAGIASVLANEDCTMVTGSSTSYSQVEPFEYLAESASFPKDGLHTDSRGGMAIPQQYLDTSLQNTPYPSSHTYSSSGLDLRRYESAPGPSFNDTYTPLHSAPYREQVVLQHGAVPPSLGKPGFSTTPLGSLQVPSQELTINQEPGLSLRAPRGLPGDYASSQFSRVGFNEPQQSAMNLRPIPHSHSHGSFMSSEKSPEEVRSGVGMSLPPVIASTLSYGRGAVQPKSYLDIELEYPGSSGYSQRH